MKVNNVIFDIGNVLLRWAPFDVVKNFFHEDDVHQDLTMKIFKSPIWFDLNLGKLTESEAIAAYKQQLDLPEVNFEALMVAVRESLVPLEGSVELLDELFKKGVPLYSITDNVSEIVAYLKRRYSFFEQFKGIVVSADIGVLKPSPIIYEKLINTHKLDPSECVFIDDLEKNAQGARDVGMQAIQFFNADQCRQDLRKFGFDV